MFIPEGAKYVISKLEDNGFEAFLVGGCVRDSLMKRCPPDYDITTNATPDEMLCVFKDDKTLTHGLKHGTVTVVVKGECFEVTTYRIDGEYLDSRHPQSVEFSRNLKDDLSRRDFTMNAIAYSEKCGYVDEFCGISDIENKIIKCVGKPDKRFNEDALRILRCIRFSSVLGFDIEKNTSDSIIKNAHLLNNISSERIKEEFLKLLSGNNAADVLKLYKNVIEIFIPEICNIDDTVYNKICESLCKSDDNKVLSLCVFFSMFDNETIAKKILLRLKFDNNTINSVLCVIRNLNNKDLSFSKPKIKLLLKDNSKDNVALFFDTLVCLNYDIGSADKLLVEIIENNECYNLKNLDISGDDLVKIGVQKGRQLGQILDTLLFEVINDNLQNDKETLLKFAKQNLIKE